MTWFQLAASAVSCFCFLLVVWMCFAREKLKITKEDKKPPKPPHRGKK